MLLYRVTFSSSNGSHVCDVEAEDSDQAFRFAYAKLQNRDRYTDAAVEEITRDQSQLASNLNPMTIMRKSLIQII